MFDVDTRPVKVSRSDPRVFRVDYTLPFLDQIKDSKKVIDPSINEENFCGDPSLGILIYKAIPIDIEIHTTEQCDTWFNDTSWSHWPDGPTMLQIPEKLFKDHWLVNPGKKIINGNGELCVVVLKTDNGVAQLTLHPLTKGFDKKCLRIAVRRLSANDFEDDGSIM